MILDRSTFEELSGNILHYTKAHVLSCVCAVKRNLEVQPTHVSIIFSTLAFQPRYPVYQKLSTTDPRCREGKEEEERESQSIRKW